MSDEEEDYMSDKFLAKEVDVRPSLIQGRGQKRKVQLENKSQEILKRQRETSGKGNRNEKLQESLKNAITEDNKGFQLLAKMGYKPGQALGKAPTTAEESETAKSRLTEPVGITIKENRSGLGREAALKELHDKQKQLRQQRMLEKLGSAEMLSTEEFRRRANAKAQERFVAGALKGCQQTCQNLDDAAGLVKPAMIWFWPERQEDLSEKYDQWIINKNLEAPKHPFDVSSKQSNENIKIGLPGTKRSSVDEELREFIYTENKLACTETIIEGQWTTITLEEAVQCRICGLQTEAIGHHIEEDHAETMRHIRCPICPKETKWNLERKWFMEEGIKHLLSRHEDFLLRLMSKNHNKAGAEASILQHGDSLTEQIVTTDEEIEYTAAEKLEMLTSYLRTAYIFCFWCGVKYNDLADLEKNCPGLTRDEH